jgi:hypothetical protein
MYPPIALVILQKDIVLIAMRDMICFTRLLHFSPWSKFELCRSGMHDATNLCLQLVLVVLSTQLYRAYRIQSVKENNNLLYLLYKVGSTKAT